VVSPCLAVRSSVSTFAELSTVVPTFRFSMWVFLASVLSNRLTENLQDPLSALDAHVGKAVFQQVFMKNPEGRTKILVTHALHFLPHVDYIYTIADGQIMERGTYAELMENDGVFSKFLKEFGSKQEEEETDVDEVAAEGEVAKGGKNEKGSSAVAALKGQFEKGKTIMQEEERSVGAVNWKVYKTYLTAGNGHILVPVLLLALLLVQGTQVMSSYWLVFWQEQQFHRPPKFYVCGMSRFPISFILICFVRWAFMPPWESA